MTAPASVTCEVWVNGSRLADTADAYLTAVPTALEGLSVTWGRDNSMDQPATSACSLEVADRDGDTDYLHRLHVGDTVEVYAAGQVSTGGAPYDVAVDGSFEVADPADRVAATGATVTTSTRHAADGVRSLLAHSTGGGATVAIPPAPFGATSNANEWATVPTSSPGQHWTATLTVTPGTRARVTVSGAQFDHPADRQPGHAGPSVDVLGDGSTSTAVTLEWTMSAAAGTGYPGIWLTIADQAWQGTPGSWATQPDTWADWSATWFDAMTLLAPPTAARRVLVFTGRITDLATTWQSGARCAITASDWTADLANDLVSSEDAWAAQTLAARVSRIRNLASTLFAVDVDPGPGALVVTWRAPFDAQAIAAMLGELAVTADAVLWPSFTATRGFYLWLEDVAARGALGTLYLDTDTGVVEIETTRPAEAITLSACDLPADGVQWVQDSTDIISRASVTWQRQDVDYGGTGIPWQDLNPVTDWASFDARTWENLWGPAPTEQRVTLSDPALVDRYGIRGLDWTTQLTTEADAVDVIDRIFARTSSLDWHADGLEWDTAAPREFTDAVRATLLDVLDGTRRIGLPIVIFDMPAWTPGGPTTAAYLEGGQYTYSGGRWQLSFNLSPSPAGGSSVLWFDLDPAWRWADFGRDVQWGDLWGVTSTHASPRWRNVGPHPWVEDVNTWLDYIT